MFMTNSQVNTYDTRTAGNYRMHSCRTNIKKIYNSRTQDLELSSCLYYQFVKLSYF